MKDYTNSAPVFSESIKVLETSDTNHADNVNVTTKQIFQNTLSNRELLHLLMGFVYDEDREAVISMLPHNYEEGTLTLRDDMASISGERLILAMS